MPSKVVLIVVESMGSGSDTINELQFKKLVDENLDTNKFSSRYFNVPFKGSTVPAELRELCQRFTLSTSPNVSNKLSQSCLPKLLIERGYITSSYHGFTGGFFNRIEWYEDLGFEQIFFANKLLSSFSIRDRCGFLVFKGLCDNQVAQVITGQLLEEQKPEFIYWLTLNGHQPILSPPTLGKFLKCHEIDLENDRTCWTVQHAQIVINAALEMTNQIDDIGIVIVGDHSPGGLGSRMSADSVPAITIWPR